MEVLTYKTASVPQLLNNETIMNNLKETDKISDPRYIMSAGTAWLRYHTGHTLKDLQLVIKGLGLNSVILARPVDGNYKLCLPGNDQLKLNFVADFISNPYITTQLPTENEANNLKLKTAGYSCSPRYASKLRSLTEPPLGEIEGMDIHTQLQWAGIKFSVEHVIVNPDEELSKDLERAQESGVNVVLKQLTLLHSHKEKIFAYVNSKTENYVSAFGVLERISENDYAVSRLVIHLPTYLHEFDEG
jgi:hypothetical protein